MKLFDSMSGLVNRITGTGTSRDKITAATWHFERPNDQQLMKLYRSTWVARKMVDIPVDDMLREGWTWQADGPDLTALEKLEADLGVMDRLRTALTRDSVYGGAAFIVGDGAVDTTQELVPDSIGKGGLKYILVVGPGELTFREIDYTPSLNYGKPKAYYLQLQDGHEVELHPSRVITFIGMPIAAPLGVKQEHDFWGDSRLSSVMRDIAAAMSGVAGTGRLMEELAITYYKITGLTERLVEKGGEEAVGRLVDMMSRMKSSINSVPMDAADDVEVITASFAGIPEALRSLMQNVSGAADIPLTRFLGSSPDGLNATGASDIRNYYDRLVGRRAAYVEPGMRRLDEFLIRSALGRYDETVWRVWHPMWQLSETEQVDLDSKKMKILVDTSAAGIAPEHVIAEVTRSAMIDSPTFIGAEKAYEEADEMPEPDPVEVESANSLQAGAGRPPANPKLPRVVGGTDVGDNQIATAAVLSDMVPAPLYVRRDVLNAREILEWARAQGIPELMPASELHVTVLYSKNPVDWFKMGTSWQDKVEVGAGGPRALEVFGADALVLRFASDDLRWRHEGMIENGATSDYPEYSPHITISYGAADLDLDAIEPYRGRIVLGPELFQKIDEDWRAKVTADAQPRHPAGTSKGGQFASYGSVGGGAGGSPGSGVLAALNAAATPKYSANKIAELTQKPPGSLTHYEKKVVAKYHKALKAQQGGGGGGGASTKKPAEPKKPPETKKPVEPPPKVEPVPDLTYEAAKSVSTSKYSPTQIMALANTPASELSQYQKKKVAAYNKALKATKASTEKEKPSPARAAPAPVVPTKAPTAGMDAKQTALYNKALVGIAASNSGMKPDTVAKLASGEWTVDPKKPWQKQAVTQAHEIAAKIKAGKHKAPIILTSSVVAGEHVKNLISPSSVAQSKLVPLATLTPVQLTHAQHYTGTGYTKINAALRSGKPLTAKDKELQTAIQSHKLDTDATFVRGIKSSSAEKFFGGKTIHEIAPGAIIKDAGFVSSTRQIHTANAFAGRYSGHKEPGVLVVVNAKKGQSLMPVNHFSKHKGEDEFLMPAGTAFKITKIDVDTLTVHVDML